MKKKKMISIVAKNVMPLVPIFVLMGVGYAFGQQTKPNTSTSTYSATTQGFDNKIHEGVLTMFTAYFRPAVSASLFIWAAWDVVQGFIGRDKKTAWINVITLIALIFFLNVLPAAWSAVTGQ